VIRAAINKAGVQNLHYDALIAHNINLYFVNGYFFQCEFYANFALWLEEKCEMEAITSLIW
jgi:hypothetical protein